MRKLSREERCRRSLSELQMTQTTQTTQRHPIYAVLDDIRSFHNVGSIFRTSDAAFIEKVYLCGITSYPPDRRIEKTALGATQTVPWEYHVDAEEVLRTLRLQGMTIAALEITDLSIPYTKVRSEQFPIVLVVGNEVSGVDEALLKHCDIALEIPQYGFKESLNVAVAYGIVVFELVRIFRESNG